VPQPAQPGVAKPGIGRGGAEVPERGALGGAANEVGSLHRGGVAALIAVHGLRGEPVPWLASGASPSRILLEADVHVDDILVDLEDGTRALIQAKASSGTGKPFEDTVAQWCRAIVSGQCGDSDQLVMIVANPTQTLRRLARVLDWRREGVSVAASDGEKLESLKNSATTRGLDAHSAEWMLRHCAIRFVDAQDGGPQEREGAAWLDSSVVAAGTGLPGFRALRASFRDHAAIRAPSDLARWRAWISRAGLALVANPDGVLAARLQAEDEALNEYLMRMEADKDVLPLADLGFGVSSLSLPGLANGLRASRESRPADSASDHILPLARRQGRIFLVGRPGTGKYVALTQIAANVASSPRAPTPLRMELRELARRLPPHGPYRLRPEDVARIVAGPDRPQLADALRRRLINGACLLLLDALDEVGHRRDAVVEAIGSLLKELPLAADVVVASRHSSVGTAATLGLPVFELREPRDLDAMPLRLS
jgi:hypothetical protein